MKEMWKRKRKHYELIELKKHKISKSKNHEELKRMRNKEEGKEGIKGKRK